MTEERTRSKVEQRKGCHNEMAVLAIIIVKYCEMIVR